MKRTGGSRRKKRGLFTKHTREKGKISLRNYLEEYSPGDRVNLIVEPSVQKGLYFPRFAGKTGVVVKKMGSCYEVKIKDFNKEKIIIAHPIHLKRVVNK